MEPRQFPPLSLPAAKSTISTNSRLGICTVPSHRPAAISSARETSVEARRRINAIRMRRPIACIVPEWRRSCNLLFPSRLCRPRCMWLSEPRLDSSLLDETVAFQTEKMSANRVIGELECGCEVVHGLLAPPQLLKNLPARAFEQSLSPTSRLHSKTLRSAASKSKL